MIKTFFVLLCLASLSLSLDPQNREGVRVAIGQTLVSAALTSVVDPVVFLLNSYHGYLPSINDTERVGLIDVHLTTENSTLYNLTVASTFGEWIADRNSLKIQMSGITGNFDTDYTYHYWSVWTHHGSGSIEAYFIDSSGWIEVEFGTDGDGHLKLTYLDSHIQLSGLQISFTGDWSFIFNHVPGIDAIIKRRINKKFKEICRFAVNKMDEVFAIMPMNWKVLPLRRSIELNYALPDDPTVLNTGFASFPLFGSFAPTKYPTLFPPFIVSPALPLTADGIVASSPSTGSHTLSLSPPSSLFLVSNKTKSSQPIPSRPTLPRQTISVTTVSSPYQIPYPFPDEIIGQSQGQFLISPYTLDSLGWSLWVIDALNFNVTQEDIPSGVPLILNTDFFAAVIPTLFAFCPNCPVKFVFESPSYPLFNVTTEGASMTYRTVMSWYTYEKHKNTWEFAFSMFIDMGGSLFLSIDDTKMRIYGTLEIDQIDLTLDQSEIGNVNVIVLQGIVNRLVSGIVPLINDFLSDIGIPIPDLPLGMRLVEPQIYFSDGLITIETDIHFPFPRSLGRDWGEEWMKFQDVEAQVYLESQENNF
mmetsp:Transcript_34647/g.47361  ORF Transcript_34647/g.47361 Transcript_34647/m.47361 type:complete len:587 (+) Transcript_34647:39-1799(+)|eukprot:CAMPEP_0201476524 /NCGR_PEP_ID=MMETSP0151_2-20130828/1717_1 /ASSEMBLY_ACC=CAM_ASM_000257 /TAXON_ID=200890 /ORGANISM="Paramoeba atlantica, Strain 621/1 / CCAP 1560/9" /LENGTH=586 /DNA_ID=CAMNT_0047856921 /DNA_START=58 /DNA_END=1818 /DNA_ORIENTATION=-